MDLLLLLIALFLTGAGSIAVFTSWPGGVSGWPMLGFGALTLLVAGTILAASIDLGGEKDGLAPASLVVIGSDP